MPRPIKRWPNYALDSLEGTLFHLRTIDGLARQIQEEIAEGDTSQVMILSSDIRNRSVDARSLLHQARSGEYEPATNP